MAQTDTLGQPQWKTISTQLTLTVFKFNVA